MLLTADRALLSGLIDYAGLFPPASLDMAAAVAEYREARRGPHSWMLGSFICPASRLEELAGVLIVSMRSDDTPWTVSVILDGQPGSAAVSARSFAAEMEPAATVSMLELRLPAEVCAAVDASDAAAELGPFVGAALSVSPTALPYFEVSRTPQWGRGIPATIAALASHRERERRSLGAKLRCGGLLADAFPSIEQIVTFMRACRDHRLPFKATAGLHHPIRHLDEDLGVMRHGFLNLLVAAALCEAGATDETLRAVLGETDELGFSMSPAAVRWRDETIPSRRVQQLRAERFASYGSCSFDEPVADLVTLGMLAEGA